MDIDVEASISLDFNTSNSGNSTKNSYKKFGKRIVRKTLLGKVRKNILLMQ